jgi:hypothetical protein
MADFSTDVQPIVAQPMEPIRPTTINPAAMGLNSMGSILGSIVPGVRENMMYQRELAMRNRIQGVQADYSQHLLQIADAVDQGKMSSVQAKMQSRSLFYQYVGNYPNMTSELLQTHKDVMADAGLGSDISQGTQAEQLQNQMRQSAAKDGFIPAGADIDTANRGTQMWQQFQLAGHALAQSQQELEYQRGQIGLVKDNVDLQAARQNYVTGGIDQQAARLNLAMKNQQFTSQNAIASGAQALQWKVNNDLMGIDKDLQAGIITPQQAQMRAQQSWASAQSTISQVAPAAGADYVNNMTAPMKTLVGSYMDKFSGKVDAQTAQNQVDAAMAHNQVLAINSSPLFAKVAAESKLFPQIVQPFQDVLTNQVLSNLGQNTGQVNGVPNPVDGTPDTQNYLKILTNLENQHNGGQLPNDQQTLAEFHQGIHNLVSGVSVYGPTASDPTKLNAIIQHFADPAFGKYMSSSANASHIDPNDLTQVKNIIDRQYTSTLAPLFANEFRNAKVQVGTRPADPDNGEMAMASLGADMPNMETVPTNIHPEFNGSGISFVPNDPSNPDARSKSRDLNNNLAPVFNNIMRANANLDGTRDYQKAYTDLLGKVYERMGLDNSGNPVGAGKGVLMGGDQPQTDSNPQLSLPSNGTETNAPMVDNSQAPVNGGGSGS